MGWTRRRACTFGISEHVLAGGNVDRRVESAEIDIPVRHSKDANVDPVAICLPDAYVDGKNERRGRQAGTDDDRRTPRRPAGLL